MVVLLASLDICAQRYEVLVKFKDGTPAVDVYLYRFPSERLAKEAVKSYVESDGMKNVKEKEDGRTDNQGSCEIRASKDDFIVIEEYSTLKKPEIFKLSQYLNSEGFVEITITKTKTSGKHGKGEDAVTEMEEQKVDAPKPIPPKPRAPIPASYGRTKLIQGDITIDAEYARDDARLVVFPRVVLPELDSVFYLEPAVVDGVSYSNTMTRRMGFESSNDKLRFYRQDASFYMKSHADDVFNIVRYVEIDKDVKFYSDAEIWYEDYNGVYNKYVKKLHNGKEAKPMRFLDWEVAKRSVKIDTLQYYRRGQAGKANESENFRLNFKVNEEILNLSDESTLFERDRLLDKLRGYAANTDVEVLGITVRGYSSPEGRYARNTVLSKGRTNHVVSLLKKEFPRWAPDIKPAFDEHMNVVSWDFVANTMENSTDSIARQYASIIKKVVARENDFDDQQEELIKNKELWSYVKDSVLPSVRRVEVSTEIEVAKVLSLSEIIDGYYNGTLFVPGKKVLGYQYYEFMRWLSDNEKWDDLYKISKMAYEDRDMYEKGKVRRVLRGYVNPKNSKLHGDTIDLYLKSHPGDSYLQIDVTSSTLDLAYSIPEHKDSVRIEYYLNGRPVTPKSVQKPGKYLFEILVDGIVPLYQQTIELVASKPTVLVLNRVEENGEYPYPLAAYYYANSLLRRGVVDTSIMSQYLDDGTDVKKLNRVTMYNDPAMIVTQILMHCQDDDFVSANRLITKYRLSKDDPDLRPLIMFVKCLSGEFDSQDIQDFVKSTSPLNHAVILAAQEQWRNALVILDTLSQDDARVQYLKAICKYKNLGSNFTQLDQPPYEGLYINSIGEPMLKAFELDKENVNFIQNDGYFNDAYRLLVLYFWKREQEGLKREDVIKEYDSLVKKTVSK